MASQLPKSLASWSLIRSFLSLAYFLEYGPAARELNVSVPTLRRRIQRLETYLGCSLLVYDRRTMQLTEAGQQALEIATSADRRIAAIRDNEEQIRQASRPPLRLAMDENVLTYFWIPFCVRHAALLERYQISVHVDRIPDFTPGADTDCALSFGDAPQLAAITEPVGSFGVYFASHEAYVAQHGIPTFDTNTPSFARRRRCLERWVAPCWMMSNVCLARPSGSILQASPTKRPGWVWAISSARHGWSARATCSFPVFRSSQWWPTPVSVKIFLPTQAIGRSSTRSPKRRSSSSGTATPKRSLFPSRQRSVSRRAKKSGHSTRWHGVGYRAAPKKVVGVWTRFRPPDAALALPTCLL